MDSCKIVESRLEDHPAEHVRLPVLTNRDCAAAGLVKASRLHTANPCRLWIGKLGVTNLNCVVARTKCETSNIRVRRRLSFPQREGSFSVSVLGCRARD